MADAYMGSGYRNRDAVDRARAVKEPRQQFLAPGFPVEAPAAPPPSLPPAVSGAAAGAGAAAGVPVAAGLGVLAGLGFGAWVKSDIDRFNREAKLPWYDTEYSYRGGRDNWALANWDRGQDVDFDLEADLQTQDDIRRQVQKYYLRPFNVPPGFYRGDYAHGPVYETCGLFGCQTNWWEFVDTCPSGNQATHWQTREFAPCSPTYWNPTMNWWNVDGTGSCTPTLVGAQANLGTAFSDALFICPSDPQNAAVQVGGYYIVSPGVIVTKEAWQLRQSVPAGYELPPIGTGSGIGVVAAPLFLPDTDYVVGYGTPAGWPDWVAPAGSQPSMAQQLLDAKHPGGKASGGYVVPASVRHPMTIIRPAPGSPPVSVPDVIIDPGTETDPGGVVIVPPGHPPGNPTDDAAKEKKPWQQKVVHGGFVAINAVTETQDFMEAMYEGLPKRLRRKGRNGGDVPPWLIAQDIWDNFGAWDAQVAIEALVNNQIEDAIYGRFFGFQARVQRKSGVTAGLGRGVKGYRPTKLVVPEVHFAHGEFGVSFGEWSIGE